LRKRRENRPWVRVIRGASNLPKNRQLFTYVRAFRLKRHFAQRQARQTAVQTRFLRCIWLFGGKILGNGKTDVFGQHSQQCKSFILFLSKGCFARVFFFPFPFRRNACFLT